MQYKVIDMMGGLRTARALSEFAACAATRAGDGYLDLYGKRLAVPFNLTEHEFHKIVREKTCDELVTVLTEKCTGSISLEEYVPLLDKWGVEKTVLGAWNEGEKSGPVADNDYLSSLTKLYPTKFIGFAGVNPHEGMKAVRELERCVRELGLKGLVLRPFGLEMCATDRRFYPLYAKAVELNIPIWLHTSINYSYTIAMDYGRPGYVDQVACDFPELKMILGHGGWPWVEEAIAVCMKHPNVYIDFSSILPKYLVTPDTGWGALIRYGGTILQNKILFASGWAMLGMSVEHLIEEVIKLPLNPGVAEKWLYKNAAGLLGLSPV